VVLRAVVVETIPESTTSSESFVTVVVRAVVVVDRTRPLNRLAGLKLLGVIVVTSISSSEFAVVLIEGEVLPIVVVRKRANRLPGTKLRAVVVVVWMAFTFSVCSSESLATGLLVVVPRKLLNRFLGKLRGVVVDGDGVTISTCSPESFKIVVAAVVVVALSRLKRLTTELRTVVGRAVLIESSRSEDSLDLAVVGARTVVVFAVVARTRLNRLPDGELRTVVVVATTTSSLESCAVVVVVILAVVVRIRPKTRLPESLCWA
jgi:hypothetical protein